MAQWTRMIFITGAFQSLNYESPGLDVNVTVTELTKGKPSLETFTLQWGGILSRPIDISAPESEVLVSIPPAELNASVHLHCLEGDMCVLPWRCSQQWRPCWWQNVPKRSCLWRTMKWHFSKTMRWTPLGKAENGPELPYTQFISNGQISIVILFSCRFLIQWMGYASLIQRRSVANTPLWTPITCFCITIQRTRGAPMALYHSRGTARWVTGPRFTVCSLLLPESGFNNTFLRFTVWREFIWE